MRIAKSTLFFLMIILLLSIFISNVLNVINVDSYAYGGEVSRNGQQHDDIEAKWTTPKKYNIGNSFQNLMWFLQISDIHISIFRDPSRISDFQDFANQTVGTFKPYVVLASGDLTDAKTTDKMGSRQILEEWVHYKEILDKVNITSKTIWLDVRGNHDNFNVLSIKSKENYFLNYSIQGRNHPRSYMHQITVGAEKYSFIAVDACLEPGPRRPFNFVGALDEKEIKHVEKLANETRITGGDYIVWFGHYPSSSIIAQCSGGVRSILGRYREGMAYLCGHFHMLGGLAPALYTLQQAGFLELELADWKDNRMYRVAAIDHGQFSFVDMRHNDWPVALITNPKHLQFAMPHKENLQSIIDSTHIRVLAFSTSSIVLVEVKVNNDSWIKCKHVQGPLYVAEWTPKLYHIGIHYITARVMDAEDREKTVDQPFSLDGTRLPFRVLSRILLMADATRIFQFFFVTVLIILVLPLSLLRFLHVFYEGNRRRAPNLRIKIFQCWLRKLCILAIVDRLFFPLVIYELYLSIGPWIIGEIIDNHIGVVFAWGTIIGDSFLPGSFTYVYGFFQLFSFHLPLTVILAHRLDKRLQMLDKPQKCRPSLLLTLWQHFPFILLSTMQLSMIYFFWLAYGTLATLLCPLRTWSIFLALFLWHQVHKMPEKCLRSAANLWYPNSPIAQRAMSEKQKSDTNYE